MASSLQKQQELHIVIVPLMSPGHFIPVLDMAILLAQRRGVTATIVTTSFVASLFKPRVDRAVQSGHQVKLLSLGFPTAEVGLPDGFHTMEDIDSSDKLEKFFVGLGRLQQPFEELFRAIDPRPSCIIADKLITWLVDTARKFSTPRIIFDGMGCFTLMCNHSLRVSKAHESVVDESAPFLLPGLPHRIELTMAQLPVWIHQASSDYWKEVEISETEACGVVVNSFEELEPEYVKQLKKVKGHDRVWSIGPLSMCNKSDFDKAQRGHKASIEEAKCLEWLDQHGTSSVVYACFGSVPQLTLVQVIELGLGLEASGRPFIWVVTGNQKLREEIDKWIIGDGFEERTKGRGLIIRGWAPQVVILSHLSVGAFLTHCGWNSTLEGVCAGVPMITWPLFCDQFFDEKFLVDVLEVGVSVGNKYAAHNLEEDNHGVVVKREMVTEAVEEVMDGGSEGEERRHKVKMLAKMAEKAIAQGGSSYLNMTLLIEHVQKLH